MQRIEEYVDDLTITDNKAIEVLQRVHTLDQMIRCGGERGEIGKGRYFRPHHNQQRSMDKGRGNFAKTIMDGKKS